MQRNSNVVVLGIRLVLDSGSRPSPRQDQEHETDLRPSTVLSTLTLPATPVLFMEESILDILQNIFFHGRQKAMIEMTWGWVYWLSLKTGKGEPIHRELSCLN